RKFWKMPLRTRMSRCARRRRERSADLTIRADQTAGAPDGREGHACYQAGRFGALHVIRRGSSAASQTKIRTSGHHGISKILALSFVGNAFANAACPSLRAAV